MPLEEHASVCTFDCPDTCSLTVTVDDGRITKVRGSEAMPFTDGVICTKVARDMTAFVHGPQRLLHPLRRVGAKGSGQAEAAQPKEGPRAATTDAPSAPCPDTRPACVHPLRML